MYGSGKSMPRDYVTAYMWFSLAAAAGNLGALQDVDVVARRMSRAQVSEA
jgi:TPR repeat protein